MTITRKIGNIEHSIKLTDQELQQASDEISAQDIANDIFSHLDEYGGDIAPMTEELWSAMSSEQCHQLAILMAKSFKIDSHSGSGTYWDNIDRHIERYLSRPGIMECLEANALG